MNAKNGSKVLLTGGGGFLGRYIAKALLDRGYRVVSFSRKKYPFLEELGVTSYQGDLGNLNEVLEAATGCDSIIHTAALAGIWGKQKDYLNTNYYGTLNIIEAARSLKIKRLIYTSSPSVAFDGRDINGLGDKIPYAKKFFCSYSYSKRLAEEAVLAANSEGMQTIALRPHLIWGPDDPHFLPRLLQRSKEGKLFRVGKLSNLVDVIYVENAANAHLDALKAMEVNTGLGGKAYFLGQERPVKLWTFIDQLLVAGGQKPLQSKSIPFPLAFGVGFLFEGIYKAIGAFHRDPPMTRFLALQLSKSHYFSHDGAKRDFSYKVKVSTEEGLRRLKLSLI
ncbi:MAG: NAD-dependent epimerase/dehydratase family protein [Oligoflexales bacterium]|nr:NAD-dependent epimerase/dehydratase family protein [Oligoflexales bacterium]